MAKYEDTVKEFHKAMALPVNVNFNTELLELRKRLIKEEVDELFIEIDAIESEIKQNQQIERHRFENLCKEMADVQYALSGLAVSFGLPLEEAFDATHNSNMSKLDDNGKPIYRADGKITKGPNYHKPDLSALKQIIGE